MRIETITYWLDEKKKVPYRGLLVNEGDGPILDMKGEKVGDVWDYHRDNEYVITIPDPNEERV
jgi:hypothetical protein